MVSSNKDNSADLLHGFDWLLCCEAISFTVLNYGILLDEFYIPSNLNKNIYLSKRFISEHST